MLNEKLFRKTLSNGTKCYIIPKKDYVQKQVAISIAYGSVDNEFKNLHDEDYTKVPYGIAHYLEHKMFEEEDVNVFDIFSELGSVVNAYTSSDLTSYYFNCVDKFDDNLDALFSFVQSPYFTDETVEKEKGIIVSEIKMYEDRPGFMLYYNLLGALYVNHPVKDNIAGTVDSISNIDKDLLYKCYNTFYTPSNMTVVCVGDLKPDELFEKIDNLILPKITEEIIRCSVVEPVSISKQEVRKQMHVSMPMYMIGFKDLDFSNISLKIVAAKLLLDILIGVSSPLYQQLYNDSVTDDSLSIDHIRGKSYAHNVILGYSNEPQRILDSLIAEIKRLKKSGISDEHFFRLKKKHIGNFIRGFNNIGTISMGQIDLASKETDLLKFMNTIDNITKDDVINYLHNNIIEDNVAMSIILP